ncbi:hypothetical protein WN51_04702 [Melipona quadrifasciata]|uniref:Uncharacterized protein n=1 Tax=Melipona quadrifasciata TaxID=166423 RepID=A0A0M9AAZ9_9HYME|nr:hypothetical protein WN51_04702 [Melipona quadrifasciata]
MAINVHVCVSVDASILTGSESVGEGIKFALENTANRDYPENFGAQVEKLLRLVSATKCETASVETVELRLRVGPTVFKPGSELIRPPYQK